MSRYLFPRILNMILLSPIILASGYDRFNSFMFAKFDFSNSKYQVNKPFFASGYFLQYSRRSFLAIILNTSQGTKVFYK